MMSSVRNRTTLVLAFFIFCFFLSPQIAFSQNSETPIYEEEWKPNLDLDGEEEPSPEGVDAKFSEEFHFPEQKTDSKELFKLDDPILQELHKIEESTQDKDAQSLSPTSPKKDEDKTPPPQENVPAPIETPPGQLQQNIPTTPAVTPGRVESNVNDAPQDTSRGILINFNNVNIVEFIRFISRASNKNFIYDESLLNFNVSIVSEEPTSIENIMTALMQVLRVHGLSLIEQGNNIIIHNNKAISQVSKVVADGVRREGENESSELITRVFRLNTLDAEKAATIVAPLVSEGALVEVLNDTNNLIVTDVTSNVEKIGELLKSLDAPNSGLTIGQYVVVNALVDSLIGLAERVMEPIADGKPLVFVAHYPSNSIFIVSTPFIVDRSLAVLKTLDVNVGETRIFSPDALRFKTAQQEKQERQEKGEPPEEKAPVPIPPPQQGERPPSGILESASPWSTDLPSGHIERIKFYIHKLRYRKGEQIVDALGRIGFSLQETGSGNIDLISSIQSIQWLEASNSLVFTGTVTSIAKVKELIDEIDTPLRQVYIEMLILQTDLDDSLDYGVNFGARFRGDDVAGAEAFLSGANTLSSALDNAVPNVLLDPSSLARDTGYHLGLIGRNVSHCGVNFSSIGALVKAVHDKGKTEILMNPKLLVEDNSPAEIFVGLNTPFKTQSITNDQGNIITNNFEYRDVGTLMKITPLISNNDIITLDIQEEVSSIVEAPILEATTLDQQNIGLTTRLSRTTTKVHIPNKYFLVMSGMIQNEESRRRNQVPCLGGAPILGGLFSDKRLRNQKRNLMIFIRPQIIDSSEDIDDITRHQQDAFRIHNRTKKMWKYEVEEALDLLNVKEPDVSLHDSEEFNP